MTALTTYENIILVIVFWQFIVGVAFAIGFLLFILASKITEDAPRNTFFAGCYIAALGIIASGVFLGHGTFAVFSIVAGIGLILSITGAIIARKIKSRR